MVKDKNRDIEDCDDKGLNWPPEDIKLLICNIDKLTPSRRKLLSYNRSKTLDLNWKEVAFKNYSADQCIEMWKKLQRQVRKKRSLSELLKDVKKLVRRREHLIKTMKMYEDKPKHPKNAFMCFFNAKKSSIKQSNPGCDAVDISRTASKKFKTLDPKEKRKYQLLSEETRKQYELEKKEFMERHPECVIGTRNKQKVLSELKIDVDKKYLKTPFELFYLFRKQKMGDENDKKQLWEMCQLEWQEKSDEDKYFWINWSQEQYLVFKIDSEETAKTYENYPRFKTKVKSPLTNSEKLILKKFSKKPNMSSLNGFNTFSKHVLKYKKLKKLKLPLIELNDLLSFHWRSLHSDAKDVFCLYTEQQKTQYLKKLEKYKKTMSENDKILDLYENKRSIRRSERVSNKLTSKVCKTEEIKTETDTSQRPEEPVVQRTVEEFYEFYNKMCRTVSYSPWSSLDENDKKYILGKWKNHITENIIKYEQFLKSLTERELEEYISKMNATQI